MSVQTAPAQRNLCTPTAPVPTQGRLGSPGRSAWRSGCRLGSFLEIEVVLGDGDTAAEGERIARELLAALGVPESALVAHAYIDLLEELRVG